LVQLALLGGSDLEQYAILLVRVSLALFFTISGANELFVAGSTRTMYETRVEKKLGILVWRGLGTVTKLEEVTRSAASKKNRRTREGRS